MFDAYQTDALRVSDPHETTVFRLLDTLNTYKTIVAILPVGPYVLQSRPMLLRQSLQHFGGDRPADATVTRTASSNPNLSTIM